MQGEPGSEISTAKSTRIAPRNYTTSADATNARGFTFFGGVPLRGIYDNMKTAVTTVFVGKERVFNRRFLVMANHYMVEPTACSPAAGWEKGQVEHPSGGGSLGPILIALLLYAAVRCPLELFQVECVDL